MSPHTIGDDQPWPGDRHRPSDVLRRRPVIGNVAVAGATPLMSWPRNPGHVSSGFGFAAEIVAVTNSVTNSRKRCDAWQRVYFTDTLAEDTEPQALRDHNGAADKPRRRPKRRATAPGQLGVDLPVFASRSTAVGLTSIGGTATPPESNCSSTPPAGAPPGVLPALSPSLSSFLSAPRTVIGHLSDGSICTSSDVPWCERTPRNSVTSSSRRRTRSVELPRVGRGPP